MFLSLKDMMDITRRYATEPGDVRWTDALLIDLINKGQDYIARKLRTIQAEWFYRQATISTASSTNNYQLPWDCGQVMRVHIGIYDWTKIMPWQSAEYESTSYSNTGNMHYYFRGNEIIIAETSVSASDTIKVEYQRTQLPQLHYGTAEAGSTTQITLDATPLVSAVEYGTTMALDDYYNQAKVLTISGTGSGQFNTITDYVGSTRVCTVPTWTTPDSTTVYSIVSELPADLHHFFSDWAGLQIKKYEAKTIAGDMAILMEEVEDAMNEYSSRQVHRYVDYTTDIYETV